MTNKYKLKKWYPSLPKDWEVGMEIGAGLLGFEDRYSPCDTKYIGRFIYKNEVENNPEFWELVVEKDWEVLKTEYIPGKRGFDTDDTSNMYKITSIKRLSDGEIFSVGDLITYRKRHGFGEWKINSFSLEDNEILAECTRISLWDTYPVKVSEPITNLKKLIKKPILITEDGVEIFEGDEFWFVDTYFEFWHGIAYDSDIRNKYKHFSTKEAAEKYIKENKPIYSKKDMLSFGASMSSRLYPYQCEGCLEQWKKFKKGE